MKRPLLHVFYELLRTLHFPCDFLKRSCRQSVVLFVVLLTVSGLVERPTFGQDTVISLTERLKTYHYGGDAGVLDAVVIQVKEARSAPTLRRQLADALAAVLRSDASFEAKQFACRQLAFIGGTEQVSALTGLLQDYKLAHYALSALLQIPGKEVDAALLAELPKTPQRNLNPTKIEIITILGERGYTPAIAALTTLLASQDQLTAAAAAMAMARMHNANVVEPLKNVYSKATGEERTVLAEALLECAFENFKRGEKATALSLYTLLDQPGNSPAIRAAALQGIVTVRGEDGLTVLEQALNEDGSRRQMVAAELARTVPGESATRTFCAYLPKLTVQGQTLLVAALTDRRDPIAAPAIRELCASQNASVRIAALNALGSLGDASSVPMLLSVAATAGPDERATARESLARLNGKGVDQALLTALDNSKLEVKIEAIHSLGQRQSIASASRLLREAAGPQPAVSEAALHVLRDIAPASSMPALVELSTTISPDRRDATVEAVIGVAKRSNETTLVSEVKRRLSANTKPAERVALLDILGQVGGPEALEPLRKALSDPDPEIQNTAISVLAEWPTDAPLPDLLHTVQTSSNVRQRAIALRGYVRLIGANEQRAPIQTLKLYKQVATLLTRADEKRLALAGLAKVKSVDALAYAAGFLPDNDVHGEAELAVLEISGSTFGAYPEPTRSMLDKIVKSGSTDEARKRATELLTRAAKMGDYIAAWEVSPVYQQDGADYLKLFDIPFPPEQNSHAGEVPWRLMPVSTSAEQPWLLDLLALYGGEQKVAYLRTEVWSETARDLILEVGSDDGVKCWWNGQVIVTDNTAHAVVPGQEKVKVMVKSGWNRLLMKVTQNNQGWGACARLTNTDGSPATALKYRVPIN